MGSIKQTLLPDPFSFVQESVDNFFGQIYNEFNLSLKVALREYTEYHVHMCNYTGFVSSPQELTIYYKFNYNSDQELATLENVFLYPPKLNTYLHTITY